MKFFLIYQLFKSTANLFLQAFDKVTNDIDTSRQNLKF